MLYQRRHILACHNEEIANQWVTFLIQGAVYTNFLEENLEKVVKRSMITGDGGEIASYFGRIKEEIELDDLPPNQNGINTKSQAQALKDKPTFLERLTSSFQMNSKSSTKRPEEKKEIVTSKNKNNEEVSNVSDEKINFQSFQILNVLGSGAFGKVYKVKFV